MALYTVNAEASASAAQFASLLNQALQVANQLANTAAEMDTVIGGGAVWANLTARYGIELDGTPTTDAEVQAVYNLLQQSESEQNGTEATPNGTRQLVTQVKRK